LWLQANGKTVLDCGPTLADEAVDYPDYAENVCDKVLNTSVKQGILICGTGIGMSIAANKINGIRAARVVTVADARFSRLHNNSNVLCIGEATHDVETVIQEWLATDFEGGRHERRVNKIQALERHGR
jgi:ribose 5-phosphate isomerase B